MDIRAEVDASGRWRYGSAPPDLPPHPGPRRDKPLPPAPWLPKPPPPAQPIPLHLKLLSFLHTLYAALAVHVRARGAQLAASWRERLGLLGLRLAEWRVHLADLGVRLAAFSRIATHVVATLGLWLHWAFDPLRPLFARLAAYYAAHHGWIWSRFLAFSIMFMVLEACVSQVRTDLEDRFTLYQSASRPAFFDSFDRTCPPVFLYYPDYARAIGLPQPLMPSLTPLQWATQPVNYAYRRQHPCFLPGHGKDRRHPDDAIDAPYLERIFRVQKDAKAKLDLGEGYPRWHSMSPVEQSPMWNSPISREDADLPRYGNGSCSLREALWDAASQMWTGRYRLAPSTMEEAEARGWYPCDVKTAWAPFAYVADFDCGWKVLWKEWRLVHMDWKQNNLPPPVVHPIWTDDTVWTLPPPPCRHETLSFLDYHFQRIAYRVFARFLVHLRAWGRGSAITEPLKARIARDSLSIEQKKDFIRAGWLSVRDFSPFDPVVQEINQRRKELEREARHEKQGKRERHWDDVKRADRKKDNEQQEDGEREKEEAEEAVHKGKKRWVFW